MTIYVIRTLEMFETIAEYSVEAESEDEAVKLVASGSVGYDWHEHPGNDDEFIEVLFVNQLDEEDLELDDDLATDALLNNEVMNDPLQWWDRDN